MTVQLRCSTGSTNLTLTSALEEINGLSQELQVVLAGPFLSIMSSFSFGNLSDQSILTFDHKCLLVATPEGTPSPPELTSTVARPMLNKKVPSFRGKIVEDEAEFEAHDASYVPPPTVKKIQFQLADDDSDSTFVSFVLFVIICDKVQRSKCPKNGTMFA